LILGHEFSGEIVDCANETDKSLINKKVVIFPLLPCFECEFCKTKHYAQCKKYSYFGSRQNGAMTEYISVPRWNIKVLPEQMAYEIGSLCEPTAVAVNAINKIKQIKEKNICISGSGTIAILCGLYAKSLGGNVSFVVRNHTKIEFLKAFGFNDFIMESSENICDKDVLIECVGSNSSLNNCIKLVRSHGQIILVGNPADNMTLDKKLYWKILRSELVINGVWNSNYKNSDVDDWDIAISFLNNNQDLVKKLITDRFSLDCGIKAFEQLRDKDKIHIKGVFINEK
jgi:L-iditol 2-dehydrogenase